MVRLPRAIGVEVEKVAAAGETTVAEWIRAAVIAALRRQGSS
jgi:hypothetical protein